MSTRSDGLDGVCATDGLGARLGQPEVLHLALLNQFLYGAGDVLDGDVRVHAMLIQHVDGRHVQALQHRVGDLTNVVGPAVHPVACAIGVDSESELGRDHDSLAKRRQRLADEFFVGEGAVGFRGVEQRDATLDRGVEQRYGFLPAGGGTVDPGQPHAAVSDRRNL